MRELLQKLHFKILTDLEIWKLMKKMRMKFNSYKKD